MEFTANQIAWAIGGYLLLINLIGFITVGADKRRSVYNDSRVPEVYFFVTAAFFGSLGVFGGLYFFHHKTRKSYFPFGIGILVLQQAGFLYLLYRLVSA